MRHYLDLDIWKIFPNVKRVGVQVSGGADSALVLYTLVKCIKDADIYVITGSLNTENNFNEQYAKDVVAEVIRLTDTKSIKEHIFKRQRKRGEQAGTDPNVIYRKGMLHNVAKKYNLDLMLNGVTMNPPKGILDEGRDERRDKPMPLTVEDEWIVSPIFRPFAQTDKRSIMKQYKILDIMSLFEKTWSCEGTIESTQNFTVPCRECWWCKERQWALEVIA
jgi:7-cyano-7-deazaguanine synthase in queuosine biosynthesis